MFRIYSSVIVCAVALVFASRSQAQTCFAGTSPCAQLEHSECMPGPSEVSHCAVTAYITDQNLPGIVNPLACGCDPVCKPQTFNENMLRCNGCQPPEGPSTCKIFINGVQIEESFVNLQQFPPLTEFACGCTQNPHPTCICPANIHPDGALNGDDIPGFVQCYLGAQGISPTCQCADIDDNGNVDDLDLALFVSRLYSCRGSSRLTRVDCPPISLSEGEFPGESFPKHCLGEMSDSNYSATVLI
jgi:hypothetical protein